MFGFLLLPGASQAGIATTVHNLSTSGPGSVRASSEDRICIFCHTPHNSTPSGPLWNRNSGFSYTPYNSSTAVAHPGQPTGASLLCLSCHDGTIALGKIVNPDTTISMTGGTTMPSGTNRIGTDLTDDHPISFQFTASIANANGELVNPSSLTGTIKLDANNELQCTSCHDPHNNDLGKFLVMSNRGGALCETCHQKTNWASSPHNNSNATWGGVGTDPWPYTDWNNVSDNACQNCHQPHTANSGERLLNYVAIEDNCSPCHNGRVAQENIMGEFSKFSNHPITNNPGVHDPSETAIVNSRHVECVDCHNPHAARSTGSPAGPLVGVRGVDTNGNEINPVNREYQVCYRCHADSSGKPNALTPRRINQTNVRLEFDTGNPSYHPVEGAGANNDVPSLLSPLTTNSVIKCTDCHSNNNISGPRGPHGSTNNTLLERRYVTSDPNPYSSGDYAMCFKCHSETSLRNNASGFPHNIHIGAGGGFGMGGMGGGPINASCNVCHDPHGVASPGNSVNNSKLINFNTSVVSTNSVGALRYESTGRFQGRCYLACHGMNHNPCSYGGGGTMGGMACRGGGGGGGH